MSSIATIKKMKRQPSKEREKQDDGNMEEASSGLKSRRIALGCG